MFYSTFRVLWMVKIMPNTHNPVSCKTCICYKVQNVWLNSILIFQFAVTSNVWNVCFNRTGKNLFDANFHVSFHSSGTFHPSHPSLSSNSWWRHQMETFCPLLVRCAGNSVTRSFDVFFDLGLNKQLSKQSKHGWFETPSCSLWRHRNVNMHWQIIC